MQGFPGWFWRPGAGTWHFKSHVSCAVAPSQSELPKTPVTLQEVPPAGVRTRLETACDCYFGYTFKSSLFCVCGVMLFQVRVWSAMDSNFFRYFNCPPKGTDEPRGGSQLGGVLPAGHLGSLPGCYIVANASCYSCYIATNACFCCLSKRMREDSRGGILIGVLFFLSPLENIPFPSHIVNHHENLPGKSFVRRRFTENCPPPPRQVPLRVQKTP